MALLKLAADSASMAGDGAPSVRQPAAVAHRPSAGALPSRQQPQLASASGPARKGRASQAQAAVPERRYAGHARRAGEGGGGPLQEAWAAAASMLALEQTVAGPPPPRAGGTEAAAATAAAATAATTAAAAAAEAATETAEAAEAAAALPAVTAAATATAPASALPPPPPPPPAAQSGNGPAWVTPVLAAAHMLTHGTEVQTTKLVPVAPPPLQQGAAWSMSLEGLAAAHRKWLMGHAPHPSSSISTAGFSMPSEK